MKRFLLVLFVALGFIAQAQVYNNEWIDYNKTYYKFKVGKTGLYRISQATLATAGLDNVPAEQFQLWRNGQQVPIFTSTPSGILSGSDFIEFWGEQNDGKPDNILYRNTDYQLNDKWSLQTDTAAFFLTVNPAGGNFHLENTTNNITGTQTPEPYFMHTAGIYYRSAINSGYAASVGEYVYSSSYDIGEGWSTGNITPNPATFPAQAFNGLRIYSSGPDAMVRVHTSGNAINPRTIRVKINGDSVAGRQMDYFDYAKIEQNFPLNKLAENSTVEVNNISAVASDRMVVHKIEIIYPRQFDFGGQTSFDFNLPANVGGNYLEISNFSYGSTAPVLYDLTNGKRYVADISNPAILKIALEPSALDRRLLLVSEEPSVILPVNNLLTRNFVNYGLPANQGDYLIVSHKNLFTSSSGANNVEEYRAYRSSGAGGGFNAKIYDIDELVDQFGLGIKKHPLSVRNFLRWARATYSVPIKDVFLIGHGLNYTAYRTNEANFDAERLNLVPTFGFPASDILLSATPDNPVPQTPIGRLGAINGNEVGNYFHKVKEYEAAQAFSSPLSQDKAWMKNVVHVVGGSDEKLGNMLAEYMSKYKSIISDSVFGANVTTFNKVSTNPVEQLGSTVLPGLFQEGISMLLYFGHSSASNLSFNLDNPQNYNNKGKYPVMVMLGCNAGNFFSYNVGRFTTLGNISENFILTPERGSIAYFASTHLGIVHYLDIYNTRTYTAIGNTMYGRSIGEQVVEAIKQVYNLTTTEDYYARFHTEENTIHGDPAIKINNQAKPDYVVEEPFVRVVPSFISVSKPNFNLKAKFLNIGRVENKDIIIEVKREYPGSTVTEVIFRDTISGIHYADSISIDVPIIATRDRGVNKITVTIDAGNAVDELYETNNSITKEVVIYEDDASIVYPYNYSIVNKQNITFAASTADPFAAANQYLFEIDTTELFNSSFKKSQSLNSKGGLLEFKPTITFSDSTVYYWRVALASSAEPVWANASFIYLAGSDYGFNQSHYFQHKASGVARMAIDSVNRKWRYDSVINSLFIRNGVYPTSGTQESDFYITANEVSLIGGGCYYDELVINVFNPNTFKPMKNDFTGPTGLYGSLRAVCGGLRTYNFEYLLTTSGDRKKAMDFLDLIPDGSFVIIRGNVNQNQASNTYSSVWKSDESLHGTGNSLYHRLLNQGFYNIDSFYRPRSFIFVYKKNGQSSFAPRAVMSNGIFDRIAVNAACVTPDFLGYIESPTFGPGKAWKQLKWRGTSVPDTIAGDSPEVEVIGVGPNGAQTSLFSAITTAGQDFDLSSIDATQYPNLKLRMRNLDTINYTPYQLNYWRLLYDPVPEGAISPNLEVSIPDTVDVGEPFNLRMAFKNVSDVAFDSLRVKLIVTDKNNVPKTLVLPRYKALVAGDTVHVDYRVSTESLSGLNTLYVDVNPDNDQPEQHHYNNFAFKDVYVRPDSLNPLLDVTFDGVRILNRDLVSSKPNILIKIKDEAKWMILNDTSLVTIQIRYPDGSIHAVGFNSDTVRFTPAGQAPNPDNTATVEFLPYLQQDGDYELIVSGRDKSNNLSGKMEYRVSFQVINKPMISNMLNYPNPFTTSTAFVFTITGSEIPQNIRIQVLTVTGKVVREITKQELGPLHIGRNITEFKWDGTDQYGQKLANGIYLYRVITNLNGKALDKYKSEGDNTDKYFNKGYGKMYLMR